MSNRKEAQVDRSLFSHRCSPAYAQLRGTPPRYSLLTTLPARYPPHCFLSIGSTTECAGHHSRQQSINPTKNQYAQPVLAVCLSSTIVNWYINFIQAMALAFAAPSPASIPQSFFKIEAHDVSVHTFANLVNSVANTRRVVIPRWHAQDSMLAGLLRGSPISKLRPSLTWS